ncbi:MAG: copper resistance protein CopD [Nitrospira sp.]|nr:copper resistance protein CopD [Nitrospira sp.]
MTIILVWFHFLAAVLWIGGALFLSLVLVPILKQDPFAAQRGPLFRAIAGRFRTAVWTAVIVLVVTGALLLHRRSDLLAPTTWPLWVQVKLFLVGLLTGLTILHDFWLGPKVGRLLRAPHHAHTPAETLLIRFSPWVARLGLLLALAVLLAAAALVRS